MRPEDRRRQGTSRVILLHEDQGELDLDPLADPSPQARMEALWDLSLEYLAWTRPDDGEPRLQRSVCSIERRGS